MVFFTNGVKHTETIEQKIVSMGLEQPTRMRQGPDITFLFEAIPSDSNVITLREWAMKYGMSVYQLEEIL